MTRITLAAFFAAAPCWALAQATPVAQLAFGGFHACAVSSAGNLKCWGDNEHGQLGDGSPQQRRSTPRDVPGLATGVAAVAMGYQHSCALTTAGAVRCWGNNSSGQLGDGSTTTRTTPVNVAGLGSGVVAIAAGGYHSCAITAAGALKCWGGNTHGQLGIGDGSFTTTMLRLAPVDVTTFGSGTRNVALGGHHTCAIKADNSVWCWGENWGRQLGTATVTPPTDVPRAVTIAGGATQLSMGWEHSCARTTAGGLKCWGLNDRGQLGNGPVGDAKTGPVDVIGFTNNVAMVAAGSYHTCAASAGGAVACWGSNIFGPRGMLGDGVLVDRAHARIVPGLGSRMTSVAAGWGNSGAVAIDGTALAWGRNGDGAVGDGTFVERLFARIVADSDGSGFLDLTPENGQAVPEYLKPVFPINASSSVAGNAVTVSAQVRFRPQDLGSNANIYVFAWAPSARVIKSSVLKDDPPCVMAQVNSSGQLVATSASSMQAYTSGVLTTAGASVTLLNGVASTAVTGSTVYVGYGSSGTSMATNGTSNSAYSAPGAAECGPQPPQTGWWWNPAEGGRGYSLEMSGNRLWGAAYLYDTTGRATWYVFGGPTQFEGSVFEGDLIAASGGQTLTGAYKPFAFTTPGRITLLFSSATRGTLTWPGGTIPIERFNIVPNGLTAPDQPGVPESGWWWNEAENGRGFFIEWQNGSATLAGYMYDEQGLPTWYITVSPTPVPLGFNGTWLAFTAASLSNPNVGPASIVFTSATTATMTMPGGRVTALTRYRF